MPPPLLIENPRRLLWIRRWTVAATLGLILSTYSLWIPISSNELPQIPAFAALCNTPEFVDAILLAALLVGMLALLSERASMVTVGCCMTILSGVALVLLNQHRLQPWFYQFLLFALIFMLASPQRQILWLRILVISIYAYSALGKFDFQFFHTVGQQFLDGSLGAVGVAVERWPMNTRLMAVALFPVVELVLAAGLLAGTLTRRPALQWTVSIAACLFHLALMMILGLGLRHSWGVVLWNFQFAIQAILLFGYFTPSKQANDSDARPTLLASLRSTCAHAALCCALIMPLFERFGYWDHWTSWALYAPHSSRVELYVAQTAVGKLPDSLRQLMKVETDVLWVRVPMAQWSLAQTGAPIYPQARFELGVGRELAEQVDSEFAIRANLLSTANRHDGRRTSREILGSQKIEAAGSRFFLNTQPRRN